MSLHKLTAGDGYDYLTRQVAALDSTEKGHTSLASYYEEKGESPGVWIGSGMAGIDGLNAGDVVTAEQMSALFGLGMHPLAMDILGDRSTADIALEEIRKRTKLGAPFRLPDRMISDFRVEVARRFGIASVAAGGTSRSALAANQRAAIRGEVAREYFRAEHGRDPIDERELAGAVARYSRGPAAGVAGFDLTFSPVKSVSALWAVADPAVAAQVEMAHNAAVADALRFIETEALFTRLGANGVRQVEVEGLVAAAFTHRDSRAGDPDLHTHVAVANKVQTKDGQWRAIDGRVLYKAAVTASEVYNTAIEKHLTARLGVRFTARAQARPEARRPVREIDGVARELLARWSARRAAIESRRGVLAAEFQSAHGRPPSPVEAIQLAQQATLETRDAKHEPRTLAQQRATWAREAAQVLGDPTAVAAMVHTVLHPRTHAAVRVDAAWIDQTAREVVETVQARRATWQVWHVRAEALRRIRAADIAPGQVEHVVTLITDQALTQHSISLSRTGLASADAGVTEPEPLRRSTGESMYTVAGAQLFTSPAILAAEQSLIRHAGRTGGTHLPLEQVDLALVEVAANGLPLNDGQAAMVRAMASSGARLQLAIAPAGSGKTTAMSALAHAWTSAGGTVLGLAPSAAAAAALRDQTGATTDTMAKLTWALHHNQPLPAWADQVGPSTLVIIDEAGMADTLSLAQVNDFVIGRGGNVRLIGDTQQLAAVGAGGVLRDIDATHGALRLSEIVRFTDPAEAAASLALRDGHHEAIGFYLDRGRLHIGDPATTIENVFTAWAKDVDTGRDAIMLAATRDHVTDLNARAQTHHTNTASSPNVALADGNHAYASDVIITRRNDRTLRVTTTDFVKNGDRWDVHTVHPDGALDVTHRRTRRRITLPAAYVAAWVDLGYASTINTAQGITADTAHTLLTGAESRQQAYTALTRGRSGNHAYLHVVGDGDEHSAIRPETTYPETPAEIFARVLDRDGSPASVTTQLADLDNPATHLADAADRYLDALHVAAEHLTPPAVTAELGRDADRYVPGVTDAPAWPALRSHLLLLHAAGGPEPLLALVAAANHGGLADAHDRAAVLHWRLDTRPLNTGQPGPLPWLPAVPHALATHPDWGPYLTARADRVSSLTAALPAPTRLPEWARHRTTAPPPKLLAAIQVWRTATRVPDTHHRPTGPRQLLSATARYQSRLDAALAALDTPALDEWLPLLTRSAPTIGRDPYVLDLAERLAATSRAGIDTLALLDTAMTEHGPLPDDHAAAALWWRLHARLTPVVVTDTPPAGPAGHAPAAPTWLPDLETLVGADQLAALRAHPDWGALSATVSRAVARGWTIPDLLPHTTGEHKTTDALEGSEPAAPECDAAELLWRVAVILDPLPDIAQPEYPDHLPPDDLDILAPHHDDETRYPATASPGLDIPTPTDVDEPLPDLDPEPEPAVRDLGTDWSIAVILRELRGPLELTDREIDQQLARAYDLDTSPVPEHRLLELNAHALAFYQDHYPGSWAQTHLIERFHTDPAEHPGIRPGYAPDTWTALTTHLRRTIGASDDELLAAGLATIASTGRLIDRFRDRVLFPITRPDGHVLAFVGRRHPDSTDEDRRGPKYLNTGDTVIYRKGDHLYTAGTDVDHTRTPVLVEGPMDAIAVTLAAPDQYVGVAALGTSLTPTQARHLTTWKRDTIIATDNDPAGHQAAERNYWLLAAHGLDPLTPHLPPASDPASTYTTYGPDILIHHLHRSAPLADRLLHTILTGRDRADLETVAQLIAARPASIWFAATQQATAALSLDSDVLARHVIHAADTWNTYPARAADRQLGTPLAHPPESRTMQPPTNPTRPAVHCDGAAEPSDRGHSADAPDR